MGSVDYLKEYERILLSYGKINFGFQWWALNSSVVTIVVVVTTVYGCSDVILAYQWLVSYLLVESDKKLSEEMKNQVRFFIQLIAIYPTHIRWFYICVHTYVYLIH